MFGSLLKREWKESELSWAYLGQQLGSWKVELINVSEMKIRIFMLKAMKDGQKLD